MMSIPFENLDIHQGREIILDEAHLFRKIVRSRRGGICYELNGLFAGLLAKLGFHVTLVAAEVFDDSSTAGPPFDHLALLVTLGDAQYLVDVGFGDSFTTPLRLGEYREQASGRTSYRIRTEGQSHTVMKRSESCGAQAMKPMYRFSTTPRKLAEFNDMCVYHQTSERSHFTRKEVCSRATSSGRVTISGNQLIESDGDTRKVTELRNLEHRQYALMRYFGIQR
jgi:N-hydroxyarylamine O-acetyltransferase